MATQRKKIQPRSLTSSINKDSAIEAFIEGKPTKKEVSSNPKKATKSTKRTLLAKKAKAIKVHKRVIAFPDSLNKDLLYLKEKTGVSVHEIVLILLESAVETEKEHL